NCAAAILSRFPVEPARAVVAAGKSAFAMGPPPSRVRDAGDHFIVDAHHRFASGCTHASWFISNGRLHDADGNPVTRDGVARGALFDFAALAAGKVAREEASVLRESAVVQTVFGEAEARVRAARALVMEVAVTAWSKAEGGASASLEDRATGRLAATHAI